ncbi:MAG: LysR family transcriptional regulator [Deltaproteobacteria bacterium]|nr:LysR family transcriptional regulator [Deltaproteobacteria bacterium]
MRDLNPAHLRTFLSICQHGTYTRAGKERLLTQPAVSRQMKRLAEDLEVPVFERVGRSLHLTDAGRALQERARGILAELEYAAEAIRAYGTRAQGRIRIGASTTPGLYLLPAILTTFGASCPDVEVDYRVDSSRSIEAMLLGNEIDLGYVGVRLTSDELRFEEICRDRIECVAAASHPLTRRRSVPADVVAGEVWVVRPRGSATRQLVERWFASHQLQPSSVIELGGAEDVKALIAAGVGVGFSSHHGLGDAKRRGLARVKVRELELRRKLYFARHRHKHLSPAMVAFVETVATALRPLKQR